MRIGIGGPPCSGKSTQAQRLAKYIGYDFYSAGGFRRAIAKERGIKIEDLNELDRGLPYEKTTDRLVDDRTKELNGKDNFVLESRLGVYFIKNAITIYLDVDPRVAAERVLKDQRPEERKYSSVEEAMKEQQDREKSDAMRYKNFYRITDYPGIRRYDIVIDTTGKSKDQVFEEVVRYINKRSKESASAGI